MYLLNEIRALLWPSAKGIYLTPEMIYSPDDIIDDMKNKYKKEHAEIVNGYEIVGNNSIDFIDSDSFRPSTMCGCPACSKPPTRRFWFVAATPTPSLVSSASRVSCTACCAAPGLATTYLPAMNARG